MNSIMNGNLNFWLPAAVVWLGCMFFVGWRKWACIDGVIYKRDGYEYNYSIVAYAEIWTVLSCFFTWRPLSISIISLFSTGKGDSSLAIWAYALVPILWMVYGYACYGIGRLGSIIKWRQVNRQRRCSEITAMLDRVTKNF